MQSLGEIKQLEPAVGAKIWRLYVFVCLSRSDAHAVCSRGHSLIMYCVRVYRSILMLFQFFILRFSLRRQIAPQQSTKFRAACFHQFSSSLRKDSVANYGSIWMQFPPSVTGLDVLYNALNVFVVLSVGGATRFANLQWKFSKMQKIGRRFHVKYFVQLLLR